MSGLRLCGLWTKKAPNSDKDYLEGKIGFATIRIYQNDYWKTDKDPAYVVYLSQTPFDGQKKASSPTPQRARPRITPRVQPKPGNVAPQRTAYIDHTKSSPSFEDGPPEDGAPWPTDEDMPF